MNRRSLFVGTNRQADPGNMTDLEKRHIPVIDAPQSVGRAQRFDVTVQVGSYLAHPNERDHFIEFMDLYADETYLARVSFTAGASWPKAAFSVALNEPFTELRALARCNLHGVWLGRTPIQVRA